MTADHVGSDRPPVRVHVTSAGNQFFDDLGAWLVEAAIRSGRAASLVHDRLPTLDGAIHLVVAPHEYYELADAPKAALQHAAAVSIPLCTEQPGTPWFHLAVDACRRTSLCIDINPHGVAALRDLGFAAEHLQLGAVPSMSAPGVERSIAEPEIDVLFLGGLDDRRGEILAELAPGLVRRRCELRLFRFERPSRHGAPGLVFGDDKYALLARSRLLLNLHRDRSAHLAAGTRDVPYFEWARVVEAMANGCVVVTETSEGYEPLEPGVHFVQVSRKGLADTIDALLEDATRCAEIADAAKTAVHGPLALERSLAALLDRIEADVLPSLPHRAATIDPTKGLWRLGGSKVAPPVRLGAFRPYLELQREAKRIALAENRALRRLDAATCLLAHGTEQHVVQHATPAWSTSSPEVSVVVTLYNYAGVVRETLDSVAASEDVAFEIIVVEDRATDASRAVVVDYLAAHPDVPSVLLAKDANEGLAAARNAGFAAARGELVMVMDADNHVYPTCLRWLADAMRADADAAAAYAILEDFGTQRNIRSALAWDVERLCRANYIDAQAMWRRSAWEHLGGYRDDDDEVYGWEDWDLWLRLAADGGHATLVPQVLGRYRVQPGSMIALTNLATDDALVAIRERYPTLPWGPIEC